jgi:hypothetical protein
VTDTHLQSDPGDSHEAGGVLMDEDRDWLKNPILPRPPAVPRFTAAELRLLDDERERQSGITRVAARRDRTAPLESQLSSRGSRRQQQSGPAELASEAPQSRRIA